MGKEINLLKNYPRTVRDPSLRQKNKTKSDQEIARRFDYDFFDGDRKYGYGGYNYNEKYWKGVIPDFIDYYSLNNNSSILDIGCGKGFMIYDFLKYLPGVDIKGIDISEYAIKSCKEEVKDNLIIGDAKNLPFDDSSFDLVISIVSIHNLDLNDCAKSLREINRVSKKNSFITVDAYDTEEEKKLMHDWNLTALTIMSCKEWVSFFQKNNYSGDYYWFKP
jgi:ubiquinone/menaquinone biosynthesis C-methylase UbiE